MKRIFAVLLALVLCLASVSCLAGDVTKVKVGVVGENNEQWEQVIIPTLKEEGIEIELVKFSDYIIPNEALANGRRGAERVSALQLHGQLVQGARRGAGFRLRHADRPAVHLL